VSKQSLPITVNVRVDAIHGRGAATHCGLRPMPAACHGAPLAHARTWPCGWLAALATVGVSRVAPFAGATGPNTALVGAAAQYKAAAQNDIASLSDFD